MTGTTGIHRAALVVHAGLALALAATLIAVALPPGLRLAGIAVAWLPLAATLPGLIGRRIEALRWLALALVLYAGFGTVEVMATGTLAAAAVLLAALLELGLVLMLCLRTPPRGPGATTGS